MAVPSKDELRRRLGAARRAMAATGRDAARAAVADAVLTRVRAEAWTCVAAYVPLRTEPGSLELLAGLAELGVRVLVPVMLPDKDLDWTVWGATATLGRPAVAAADAVLVPALAVSLDGTRLGRGGGSYDRALPRRRPGAPAVALLFDGELLAELPREAWDSPVTEVLCPSGRMTVGGS